MKQTLYGAVILCCAPVIAKSQVVLQELENRRHVLTVMIFPDTKGALLQNPTTQFIVTDNVLACEYMAAAARQGVTEAEPAYFAKTSCAPIGGSNIGPEDKQ